MKDVKYIWLNSCEESFRTINNAICKEPILKIFNPDKPIYLTTDASQKGFGASLKQTQEDGNLHPIGFFSMKLKPTKKRRDAIYLELLAIKKATQYWHHYLYVTKCTVITDHKPLESRKLKTQPDTKLNQLSLYLNQYDFKIIYKARKTNLEADELSRLPVLEYLNMQEEIKYANLIKEEEIRTDQIKLNKNQLNKDKDVRIHKNVWFKTQRKTNKRIERIHHHFGHIGYNKMIKIISANFYFKNMNNEIKRFCFNCQTCIMNKTRRERPFGKLSLLGPASKPYEILSLDTIGGLSGNRSPKKFIHLLIDHFTRFAWVFTSKTQSVDDFIKLIDSAIKDNNVEILLVDQYSSLNSKDFKTKIKDRKINRLMFTPVNNPSSNGLNERANQTIINRLRCAINESDKKEAWTTKLKTCIEQYNNTIHDSTGFTPKFLMTGEKESITPFENEVELKTARRLAFERSKEAHDKNSNRINPSRKNLKLSVGNKVYVGAESKLNRSKLDRIRTGPFEIIEAISPTVFKLNTNKKKSENNIFHINKIIPVRN